MSRGLSTPMRAQNAIKLTIEEPPEGAPGIAIDIMTANKLQYNSHLKNCSIKIGF